jgi:hypothetical protein
VTVGLCAACAHAKIIQTARGSTFYRCLAPGLPKYPPLPVLSCAAHEKIAPPPKT